MRKLQGNPSLVVAMDKRSVRMGTGSAATFAAVRKRGKRQPQRRDEGIEERLNDALDVGRLSSRMELSP